MNWKTIFIAIALFFSSTAYAQITLDWETDSQLKYIYLSNGLIIGEFRYKHFVVTSGSGYIDMEATLGLDGSSTTTRMWVEEGIEYAAQLKFNLDGRIVVDWDEYCYTVTLDSATSSPPGMARKLAVYSWDGLVGTWICPETVTFIPQTDELQVNASDGTFADHVRITWNEVPGATGYEVFRCTGLSPQLPNDEDSSCAAAIGSSSDNGFNDTGGLEEVSYWYRVKSCTDGVCSAFSEYDEGYRHDEDDHGNNCDEATSVNANSTSPGALQNWWAERYYDRYLGYDKDFFRVDLPSVGSLTVQTTGSTSTHGTLLDAECTEIVQSNDDDENNNFLINEELAAGTYYVGIRGVSYIANPDVYGFHKLQDDIGPYQFVSSFEPTSAQISISDVVVTEGDSGTTSAQFDVTMNFGIDEVVTVDWETANGTADSTDYTPDSGTVTFSEYQTVKTVEVAVHGDTDEETDENFYVDLSNPVNAQIDDGRGQCTITDDDELILDLLYSQVDNMANSGKSAQDFETSNDALDSEMADDFTVPAAGWQINRVTLWGFYSQDGGPAESVNLWFYPDQAGWPGDTAVCSYDGVVPFLNTAGSLTAGGIFMDLPAGCVLAPGAYWLAAQVRMAYSPYGFVYLIKRTTQSGNEAVWRNPGDGFESGALEWTRLTVVNPESTDRDMIFSLLGSVETESCYALTRSHTGSGSVPTASPANSQECPADEYVAGEVIALTASPDTDWSVGSWTGTDDDGSTSTSNAVTMPGTHRTVIVNYFSDENCSALRGLPPGYVPDQAFAVTVEVTPDGQVQAYAVEDTPPVDWPVSNISDGGTFDSINNSVKWGPFFDNQIRSLSFSVTPPLDTTGAYIFEGTASFDGNGEQICGDSEIEPGTVHPADINDSWSMAIDEVTAYGAAWKVGDIWPRPPNPIDINYVTNCGYLWKNGEVYYYDASQNPPWVLGISPLTLAVSNALGGTGISTFNPSAYTPGQPVDVSISVTPDSGVSNYAMEDVVPLGWVVSEISHSGAFDSVNNTVKWGPYFDDSIRELSYTVTPPGDANGSKTFSGQVSFDGFGVVITGDREINTPVDPIIFKDGFE